MQPPSTLSRPQAMKTPDGEGYWNRHARTYDLSMVLLGGPLPKMVELVAAAAQGAQRVLEVGAGTGLVTVALARAAREVVATDYAPAMVAQLVQRISREELTNVRAERADLRQLPFDSGSFDVVVAANVLHLVPDLRVALAELRRVVKPTGRLVLPTYCHDEAFSGRVLSRALALTGFPGKRRFTVRGLASAVRESGVQVTRTETLRGLLPIGYVEGRPGDAGS